MTAEREGDAEYGLVMPFVVVASRGGPYDDGAYCAGFEMGRLDVVLELSKLSSVGMRTLEMTIRTANVPQADLIAMQHGYRMTSERSTDVPDWTHAVFEPASSPGDDR